MGLAAGKYFIKAIFDIKIEIDIFEISSVPILNIFNFGTNLGVTVRKYLTKFIFDFKIEIGKFEISIRLNFSKF